MKTSVAGRLNGVDMARTEGYTEGEMKLHTLRQDVDYAVTTALTTYGILGVKVWVSLGEILSPKTSEAEVKEAPRKENLKRRWKTCFNQKN
nr:hypothetical protein [Metamycoplasma hominis]